MIRIDVLNTVKLINMVPDSFFRTTFILPPSYLGRRGWLKRYKDNSTYVRLFKMVKDDNF